ncbi:MAG TPA: PepSY domain-containing protein [Planctomycetota bacterium]|nr:PepSY domain-containing protein [Planctomycetota bacterium]
MVKTALYLLGLTMACLSTRHSPDRLLREAKISLPQAVEAALTEIPDGSPVSARLKEEKSRILFIVNVAHGQSALRMSIDAKTKEIVANTPLQKSYAKLSGLSKISMIKALEIATARVAGKATRVGFEFKKGKAVAEVLVFLDGKLFEVKIDAVTGSVIKVEEEDDEDDDGDDDGGDEDDD